MSGPDDRRDRPTDDELDELLAALALDAVDDAERAEIERLLAEEGPDAGGSRAAADRYARAADWLASAADPVEPPPGLWDQIAAQIGDPAAEASGQPVAPMPAPPDTTRVATHLAGKASAPPPSDELAARRVRRDGWTPVTTLVSVAAAILLVLVITVAALAFGRDSGTSTDDLASAAQAAMAEPDSLVADLEPTDAGAGMHAQVVMAPGGQTYFIGDGLPTLGADQAYQLWSVSDDGQAVSVGVLGPNPQVTMLSMGTAPGLLAVTVEPPTGSVEATTEPIVAGKLA